MVAVEQIGWQCGVVDLCLRAIMSMISFSACLCARIPLHGCNNHTCTYVLGPNLRKFKIDTGTSSG